MINARIVGVKMHSPPTRFELELDSGKTVMLTSMESGEICFACRDTLHSSTNISMVDGNGEKVQILIAGTFEGYDAVKVKFFC